jgi:hypothetical protein
MADLSQKQILQQWNEYVENVRKSTALLTGETEEQQRRRIAILEKDPELWFKYYFPQYCYAEPAPFHLKATKRVLGNMEWYEVRNWSRELAKDVRTMMEILNLCLTKKKRYMLMISNSYDNAERFLMPYKANLEANQRIIHDYGVQELPGSWSAGEFITRGGVAFRALGAGQSPRGTRNEEVRPDILVFNDIDTDEECRNPDVIEAKWKWIEDAAIGTRSISKATLVIFLGNIIAENCCVMRAREFADHVSIVNIRDEYNKSSWPQKNTEEHIDRVLSQKSYASQQKEYFNNPMQEGQAFKELVYGRCPPLKDLAFVVIYADPSTSNRDKPLQRSASKTACKAVAIVGYHDMKYYVYKCFIDHASNSTFIDWLYTCYNQVKDKVQPYTYIENNSLQNPFYEQVLLPLVYEKGKDNGGVLPVQPDARDKPDKWFRIEGTLEPINRQGLLILNIAEKEDPHMKRLEAQFKAASALSRTMDGPDAVEGAVQIIRDKAAVASVGGIGVIKRRHNNKRY